MCCSKYRGLTAAELAEEAKDEVREIVGNAHSIEQAHAATQARDHVCINAGERILKPSFWYTERLIN